MSSSRLPSDQSAWNILGPLWQMMHDILEEASPAMETIGMTPKSFFLLTIVEAHPFPAELARALQMPPPSVTYLVKQMETKGYLERRAEPGDLRKFRLVVTKEGIKAIEQGRDALGTVMGHRLARLEPRELVTLERMLAKMERPD
jgi:MarR family transcriptional regulator, organic hydroperoxide resistance regulator